MASGAAQRKRSGPNCGDDLFSPERFGALWRFINFYHCGTL
jgi:hypothetical protein